MIMPEGGPKIYYSPEGSGGGGSVSPEGGETPEAHERERREWAPGLVEKLISAERPEVVRWRLWNLLEGILDEGDDYTARILKDRLHSKTTELQEKVDPYVAAFERGGKGNGEQRALLTEFQASEKETKDILKLFLDFGGNYMRSRGSTEYLPGLAINPTTVEITPDLMQRVFSLPGFKNEKEGWPQLGDQIGDAMMAYEYIALRSDPRRVTETAYVEGTEGFRRLFGNKENAENWIDELKLAFWAKELGLEGKKFDELAPEQKQKVREQRVLSRFASKLRPERREATKTAIQKLILGVEDSENTLARKQAEIAEKLSFLSSFLLGQAAFYGSEVEVSGSKFEYTLEGYPVSDVFAEIFSPLVWALDRNQSGYFAGARSKFTSDTSTIMAGLPERMHVPFLRFHSVPDLVEPKNKLKTRSLWEELWVDGRKIGELSWNRLSEIAMRGYLLRAFLLLRKPGETGPGGILNVIRGDDWRGRRQDALFDPFYWKEVRRWIHIIVGDQLITGGQFQKWFAEREPAIAKYAAEIRHTEKKSMEDARKQAASRTLREAVANERRRWKKMIVESITGWYSNMGKPDKDRLTKDIMEKSGYWWD